MEIVLQLNHLTRITIGYSLEIDLNEDHEPSVPFFFDSKWRSVENPLGITEGIVQVHHKLFHIRHLLIFLVPNKEVPVVGSLGFTFFDVAFLDVVLQA